MRTLKTIWGVIGGLGIIVGLLTGIPLLFQTYGVYLNPFFEWFTFNAAWLLPISALLVGIALGSGIGWFVRNRRAVKEIADLAERPEKLLGMTLEEAAEVIGDEADLGERICELNDSYKRLLAWLYMDGSIESEIGDDFDWLLDEAMEPGEIEDQDFFYKTLIASYSRPGGAWVYELRPRVRHLIDKDEKIFPAYIEEVRSGQLANFIGTLRQFKESLWRPLGVEGEQ